MIPLPVHTTDENIRTLARVEKDDFTGVVGATVVLTQNPVEDHMYVWKNGLYLHNIAGADWSVSGTTVTFAVALVGGDKISVLYWARPN